MYWRFQIGFLSQFNNAFSTLFPSPNRCVAVISSTASLAILAFQSPITISIISLLDTVLMRYCTLPYNYSILPPEHPLLWLVYWLVIHASLFISTCRYPHWIQLHILVQPCHKSCHTIPPYSFVTTEKTYNRPIKIDPYLFKTIHWFIKPQQSSFPISSWLYLTYLDKSIFQYAVVVVNFAKLIRNSVIRFVHSGLFAS